MNEQIIRECKEFIDADKDLREFIDDLMNSSFDVEPHWPTIFQAVYLHACLKKRKETAEWLESLFTRFDPITQIAYRQVFFYGKWLLK